MAIAADNILPSVWTLIMRAIKLSDPDFIAGRLSTSFMERYLVEKKGGDGRLAEAV
jgi:hypothetical protein